MASSLKNRLDYEYETINTHTEKVRSINPVHTSEYTNIVPDSEEKSKTGRLLTDVQNTPVKQQRVIKKNNFSKLNISLFTIAIFLLVLQAGIYFHSVQTEIHANKMQQDIIKMKESNYKLNVQLATSQNLEKVESIAMDKLKMKASSTSEINFLMIPGSMVESDNIKVYAEPVKNRPGILTGY